MNRLKEFFGRPAGDDSPNDYYEIESRFDTFYVTHRTALDVERCLDQVPPPRWIAFRDLSGARHRAPPKCGRTSYRRAQNTDST
jgi:hypothetical protein